VLQQPLYVEANRPQLPFFLHFWYHKAVSRHCEERSNEAISSWRRRGLLRSLRSLLRNFPSPPPSPQRGEGASPLSLAGRGLEPALSRSPERSEGEAKG